MLSLGYLIALGQINTKYKMLGLPIMREGCSHIQKYRCALWGSMAEKYLCGDAHAEHPAEKRQQRASRKQQREATPSFSLCIVFLLARRKHL